MDEQKDLERIREEYHTLLEDALKRERRKFIRINEPVPVLLNGKEGNGYFFSIDLGLGGIRFLWHDPLNVGERFTLSIALDKVKTWIHLQGEVIWQRPHEGKFEIGMMFVGIDAGQKEKLDRYLQEVLAGLPPEEAGARKDGLEEKRRQPRVSKLFLTLLEVPDKPEEKIPGLILDISLGGARLITGRLIPEGTLLRLEVELEEKRLIHLEGRVVWTNRVEALKKFQHGIEFLHAVEFGRYDAEVKAMLETYIHYQSALKELNLVHALMKSIKEKKE